MNQYTAAGIRSTLATACCAVFAVVGIACAQGAPVNIGPPPTPKIPAGPKVAEPGKTLDPGTGPLVNKPTEDGKVDPNGIKKLDLQPTKSVVPSGAVKLETKKTVSTPKNPGKNEPCTDCAPPEPSQKKSKICPNPPCN